MKKYLIPLVFITVSFGLTARTFLSGTTRDTVIQDSICLASQIIGTDTSMRCFPMGKLSTSGAFLDTVTGFSAVTDSVYWALNGMQVTVSLNALTGTSSSTGMTIQHFPARITPARSQTVLIYGLTDNNSAVTTNVTATLSTTGILTFNRTFTASSVKALATYTFSYSIK